MSIPKISSVLENDYSVPKHHEETWSEYPRRKWNEFTNWITDPKTKQAIVNTEAILDGSEVRTKDEEEKYQKAINEKDPEVRDKTMNIPSGIAAIPVMAAVAATPAGAALFKVLGLVGTGKAIYDYNVADNNKDKHDAVVDGLLSASLVKPVSQDKLIKAELIRKLYNIQEPFKKFKTHVPFTIGRPKATPNSSGTMYALSK